MSNPAYKNFLQLRKKIKGEQKEKYSERTLKYYEALQEAVSRIEYETSWNYLQSVLDYIEKEEFITNKQVEICDRILEHPDDIITDEQPF
jgi:dynactin complex subunit